jgi:hypothetical protein
LIAAVTFHRVAAQTIFVADAHRGDGKRFVVRADDKLTAFVELESDIRAERLLWRCKRPAQINLARDEIENS